MRSRPDSGLGGALVSGVGGPEWDAAVWNRLVVFRDFAGRFVGVQKCGGRSLISREEVGETGRVVAFDVDRVTGRVRERTLGSAGEAVKVMSSPTKSRKRNFDEVADAEGEEVEYGWGVGDEHLFPDGTGTDSAVEEVNVVSAKSLT